MENSSYNPYVTERIRRFDGALTGVCYSAPFMHCEQESTALLNGSNIISLHNQLPDTPELIIIPLAGNSLMRFLQAPENYSSLQMENVRLAINYASLVKGDKALREAAQHFSFWLYDLAPPGTCWQNIASFPFSGIVLTDEFFNDNYLKFSFPFLLGSCREREAEVILRTQQLSLPVAAYSELQLSGWQELRTSSTLFEV
ncbi:hypothetical protein PRCB_25335 [Pantoea rodasii]|uniref:Uncharacterized protein n=1 Tax=Pantoea rodasii TaxID=1076549 RepID=A0A2M9W4M2_9GAMM|nr:hypothetical protein [Pantoea rodasii]ORM64906.1 hypothetical protein HA45_07105 [Pantoea rodasii]PJZ02484.1 hypothetical protein PRCB_25335 [Pantoea rodasii]